MEDMEDKTLDLYSDLYAIDDSATQWLKVPSHEMVEKLEALEILKNELLSKLEKAQQETEKAEGQKKVLVRNISCLFKTAQMEIARKDKLIRQLREELLAHEGKPHAQSKPSSNDPKAPAPRAQTQAQAQVQTRAPAQASQQAKEHRPLQGTCSGGRPDHDSHTDKLKRKSELPESVRADDGHKKARLAGNDDAGHQEHHHYRSRQPVELLRPGGSGYDPAAHSCERRERGADRMRHRDPYESDAGQALVQRNGSRQDPGDRLVSHAKGREEERRRSGREHHLRDDNSRSSRW
eukprot:jgi/Mesen1/863/ME000114S10939